MQGFRTVTIINFIEKWLCYGLSYYSQGGLQRSGRLQKFSLRERQSGHPRILAGALRFRQGRVRLRHVRDQYQPEDGKRKL